MKIITVNLPKPYLDAIDKLCGEYGIYPSRSELIRVAVREFLISELEAAKNFTAFSNEIDPAKPMDPSLFVQFPTGDAGFKNYRIVKK